MTVKSYLTFFRSFLLEKNDLNINDIQLRLMELISLVYEKQKLKQYIRSYATNE